ncbi:MAG TPA: arginine repressor [Acidobacteriota bacterium]|nr:arginine repressor [Acidobacteriota bacterium]
MQNGARHEKDERQRMIREMLDEGGAGSQQELVEGLEELNISATQATVSRDLVELGAVKVEGRYRLPKLEVPAITGEISLRIDAAGENLAVVRTQPGRASMLAFAIDEKELPEVVGTIAGDDTIFVACRDGQAQREAIRKIMKIFSPPGAGH